MVKKTTKPLVEENEVLENQEIEASFESTEEDFETVEESAGSETLKPNSKPAPDEMSKVEMMSKVIGSMAGMDQGDMVNFFNQVQAQYGAGKDWGVGNNSEHNKASIATSGAVKEDFDSIFAGEELTEEFKEKASTLFEAAISATVIAETTRIEEEFENQLVEQIENVQIQMVEHLNSYLDHVVEKWIEENSVAIESALRNEIMEEFIDGLKGLFAEHYVEIPNEKLNVLESLADKVEELESTLEEVIEEKSALKKIVLDNDRSNILASISEGLTMTEAEKFAALSEGIEFDGDLVKYEQKLSVVKEHYFSKKPASTVSEEFSSDFEDEKAEIVYSDPSMKRYAEAISRTIKR